MQNFIPLGQIEKRMHASKKLDWALLLLRLMFGLGMIYGHGLRKMGRLFSGEEITFANPFGIGPEASLALAVFAEVLCAGLLVVGLFTRLAAVPLIITMLVAVFIAHAGEPFKEMELGLLYLVSYIVILLAGPGWYSIDAQWDARK